MPHITLNGERRPLPAGRATVAELVAGLGLNGKRVAVEMNGEIVPKSRYPTTEVVAGDRLEIVGAVGGG